MVCHISCKLPKVLLRNKCYSYMKLFCINYKALYVYVCMVLLLKHWLCSYVRMMLQQRGPCKFRNRYDWSVSFIRAGVLSLLFTAAFSVPTTACEWVYDKPTDGLGFSTMFHPDDFLISFSFFAPSQKWKDLYIAGRTELWKNGLKILNLENLFLRT